APSSALTAFAFILIGSNEGIMMYVKVMLALLLIYSSYAYRMGWSSVLHDLESEKEKALSLGANEWLVFKKITLPLVIQKSFFIAGLCAFWASGEFAISKIIGQRDFTLAMITETFVSQYRLGFASILTLFLLLVGIGIFYLFIGAGHVLSEKIKNSI
ncbi:MAG: ABC transporter permease subunit, partial [Bdellovibrionales bacterium]|nr:ABC transporter permease subunit [Bdellovibrionales bacterium]